MPTVRRVAFVSTISSAYVHRLLRGALTYADSKSGITLRSFLLQRDFYTSQVAGTILKRLQDWKPDGLLCFLENSELNNLVEFLPPGCPVASMSAVQQRPGLASVTASFKPQAEAAVRHLREQGLRSISMVLLESEEQTQTNMEAAFREITRPTNPAKACFTEIVDPALLDDPDAIVTPVPPGLAKWLKSLPRPTGLFCPQDGGGGYIIRCCQVLGIRVPEDLAIIGSDDSDLCLATTPTLSSVMPVAEQIASEAIRVLHGMIRGQPAPKERVRLEAMDLHVRESTGKMQGQICDIAAALEYIQQHACTGLTVNALLNATQRVSNKTFHTHFKAATKQSPGEAILARQLDEARRLLAQTSLSMTSVAEKCGFTSSSDFARRFRAIQGSSPSDFRQQQRAAVVKRG